MKHLLRMLTFGLCLALTGILFTVGSAELSLEWLKFAAILPFGCAAVIKIFFWHCPHCGEDFGRTPPLRRCPKCSRPLH